MQRPAPTPRPPARAAMERTGLRTGLTLAAGLLAGLWLDTARRTSRAEREHPPSGRFIEAGGTRLHYLDRGTGQPVVFLHGNAILAEDWGLSGILDRAAERWRCIAFDRPGHGYSERHRADDSPSAQAAILRAGIRALGLEKPIIVGHSLGGAVALAWALDYPEEVGGIVFLSGFAYPTRRLDFLPFIAPAVPIAGQLLSRTVLQPVDRLLLPALMRRIFEPDPVPESYALLPIDLMLRPSQLEAGAGQLAALVPGVAALAPRYPDIRCPVAILAGEEDRIIDPRDHAVRLHRDIPHSTLHLMTGTGHMAHHARPEAVLAGIERVTKAVEVDEAHERLAT